MKLKRIILALGVIAFACAMLLGMHLRGLHQLTASSPSGEPSPPGVVDKEFWTCGMHPQVVQDHPGNCPICHMKLTPMHAGGENGNAPAERKILYWWDPMLGPSSIADKPGKSAMGMDRVPVYADAAGPGVHIDPTIVQNMGVRTAEVTRGPLGKTVRAVGVLKSPETGLYDVSVKIAGWIDKLHADQEGMHVTKGEPLFELYSQDLQVAAEELISATKTEKSLPNDASISLRQEAKSLVESARRKLQLWDIADEDIDAIARADKPPKDVTFRSPATGHLIEKIVVQGTAVQPGMKLMRIEDHSSMWLDAQVYADQFPMVKVGQTVHAAVDSFPGKTLSGTITFVSPHLDHMTRTITVRAIFENPRFELRPGMYASVEIMTQPSPDTIQAPREAVVDTGSRQIAFIAEADGHFIPRQVQMGIMGDNDMVQILKGLAPGEIVVTSGQFLMDVESRTTEAIDKLRRASKSSPIQAGK